MCVYLHAKVFWHNSNESWREGPTNTSKRTPKKPTQIKVNLIFWRWYCIHKYIYFDSVLYYGCGQANLGMPKVVCIIKSAICQKWNELWRWFFTSGKASTETPNWFKHFKKMKSLLLETQNSFNQSDCLTLSHKISPEWLGLLISFFVRQFKIMTEIYWVSFGY